MSEKIKTLILDEVATTRDSLKKLIEYQAELEAVGLAGTGEEAIVQAKKLGPDIILMDAPTAPAADKAAPSGGTSAQGSARGGVQNFDAIKLMKFAAS